MSLPCINRRTASSVTGAKLVIVAFILIFAGTVDLSIVLEGNGYNILVAISEEIPQPDDGGIDIVETLQVIIIF